MTFLYPFALLLLIIPLYYLYFHKKNENRQFAPVKLSSLAENFSVKTTKILLLENLYLFRTLAFVFLVIVIARPVSYDEMENSEIEGIDIAISLDISNSMMTNDMIPNRLEAAKQTTWDFIDKRPYDRIALVLFSGESFTLCPLTNDHNILKQYLENVGNQRIMKDGTAIGMGLATAVNRLAESKSKSRIVILLTDGMNNSGIIDPLTALDLAVKNNISVYTIGIGRMGQDFDESLLRKIAENSKGEYFYAATNQELEGIYSRIDMLEKSRIEVENQQHQNELFRPFLLAALFFLLLEFVLKYGFIRSIS
ncbi:MAG: VWA domain-containing protein [Bacteroidia bacterium]|nr:VWA domain-containing protein [Bacteroidia bacterium]